MRHFIHNDILLSRYKKKKVWTWEIWSILTFITSFIRAHIICRKCTFKRAFCRWLNDKGKIIIFLCKVLVMPYIIRNIVQKYFQLTRVYAITLSFMLWCTMKIAFRGLYLHYSVSYGEVTDICILQHGFYVTNFLRYFCSRFFKHNRLSGKKVNTVPCIIGA